MRIYERSTDAIRSKEERVRPIQLFTSNNLDLSHIGSRQKQKRDEVISKFSSTQDVTSIEPQKQTIAALKYRIKDISVFQTIQDSPRAPNFINLPI